MKVYHGTSFENFINLNKDNFEYKKNWSVSEDNMIYVYGSSDEESKECLNDAYRNAVLCAAIQDSDSNLVVVIELDIEDELLKVDRSDGNIDTNRWCIDVNKFKERIEKYKLHYYFYAPECRWMYLYNLYHSCCGMSWDLVRDYVVDIESVATACDEWYEENKEYEWRFTDKIPDFVEIHPKGFFFYYA